MTSTKRNLYFWPVAVGLTVSILSGVGSFIAGKAISVAEPPIPEVIPTSGRVKAGEPFQFSAAGSRAPANGELQFAWSVGGARIDRTSIADCWHPSAAPNLLECRFVVPGTYGVAVTVSNDEGLSATASSSVSVLLEGGYITPLVISNDLDRDEFLREMLYGIDWAEILPALPRSVVVYDPDSKRYVYPVSFVGLPEQRDIERPTGVLAGVKIAVPVPSTNPLVEALSHLGATVVSTRQSDIEMSLERGNTEIGFVSLGDPTSQPDW